MALASWPYKSAEANASMAKARTTLQLGDVVRYAFEDEAPLILFIGMEKDQFKFLRLFPKPGIARTVNYFLHGEWELCGHIDAWEAIRDEVLCGST